MMQQHDLSPSSPQLATSHPGQGHDGPKWSEGSLNILFLKHHVHTHIYIYVYIICMHINTYKYHISIYIKPRQEAWGSPQRNSSSLFAILKNDMFIVFYNLLWSFHNFTTYGISSTCGQHTWDMLSTVWKFFCFNVCQVRHFMMSS